MTQMVSQSDGKKRLTRGSRLTKLVRSKKKAAQEDEHRHLASVGAELSSAGIRTLDL